MKLTLTAGIAALMLASCASPATVTGMVAAPISQLNADSQLRSAVGMGSILGGQETNPLWTSEVGNAEFQEALSQSLAAQGMLAQGEAQFRLDAELVSVDQPLFGFDSTVTSIVKYTLLEIATDRVAFQETVSESYTATVGDAFVGVRRLRLANEGSIEANISRFIELLKQSMDTSGGTPISQLEIGPVYSAGS